ncbi:hypothetical protein [Nucisporomicrobium flavum]|uniref:hypothetical protein n=1 Tax=Nucisporomicrobium flavum TaxID=2785915 RepID=UPI0018F417C9|nr:hypothetical protein [Nucisporomicrobium flavum]
MDALPNIDLSHVDINIYIARPHDNLPAELVDAIGLDSSGCDGAERFPYTWANLSDAERAQVRALIPW